MTLETLIDDIMVQGDVLIRAFDDANDIEGEDYSEYADFEVESIYANLEQLVIEIKR